MRQRRMRTCVRLRLHDSGPVLRLHDGGPILHGFLHQLGLLQAEVQEMQAVVRPLELGQKVLRHLRFVQRAGELRLRDASGRLRARSGPAGRHPAFASG